MSNLNCQYLESHLPFAFWSEDTNERTSPILPKFHANTFPQVRTSIHLTASWFQCQLVWTEKASRVSGKSLVNFAFIFFRHLTTQESGMNACILLGAVSRSTVKGASLSWGYCMDEIKSSLFLLYMLVYSLWLPNGVKAYQKPHQSSRMSAAFMGCSSASRAVV